MFKEFKAFLMRGNVLDLAVGIIIGAAFGKIISSFVADILTPVLSLGLGKVDFSRFFFALDGQTYDSLEAAKKAGVATINWGLFANSLIDFVIVGFALFLIVRWSQKLQSEPQPVPVDSKECPHCCSMVALKATRCPACTSSL